MIVMSISLEKKLKKSLSQNFLINSNIASAIVALGCYNENVVLLEIGCGKGALTQFLFNQKKKSYHIVELDGRWAKYIYEEYKNKVNQFFVHNENILDYHLFENERYIIVGNIPYHITCPIIEKLFLWCHNIDQAIIMMQEEVAQKIAKRGGSSYGPLSVVAQLLFDIELSLKIESEYFIPQPKVNSRIVIFKKKLEQKLISEDYIFFRKYIAGFFSFPRKKIKHQGLPSCILQSLTETQKNLRAQEISPDEFLVLYCQYRKLLLEKN